MSKALKCHHSAPPFFTEGEFYPLESDSLFSYMILDDTGEEHFLTKEPDEDGNSYKTWFKVVSQ